MIRAKNCSPLLGITGHGRHLAQDPSVRTVCTLPSRKVTTTTISFPPIFPDLFSVVKYLIVVTLMKKEKALFSSGEGPDHLHFS